MAVKRPQVNDLALMLSGPFPQYPLGRWTHLIGNCEGKASVWNSNLLEGWWWRLKLSCQTRQQGGGKHWSPRQTLVQKQQPSPIQSRIVHAERLEMRRYLQLGLLIRYILSCYSNLWSRDFPVGQTQWKVFLETLCSQKTRLEVKGIQRLLAFSGLTSQHLIPTLIENISSLH